MDSSQFSQASRTLHQRAKALYRRAVKASDPAVDLLPDTLQELLTALDQLQVAEEELRQQNEELIQIQLALQREQQRYQDLFDFAPDGYLVTDVYGVIQEANLRAAELLGLPQSSLYGRLLISFVDAQARPAFRKNQLTLTQYDSEETWETKIHSRQGKSFEAELKIAAVQNTQGQVVAFRWILRDITLRQQTAQRLLTLNATLVQRTRLDETLRQIGDQLRASLDENQILQVVVQGLAQALNLQVCDAGIYDPATQTSEVRIQSTPTHGTPSRLGVVAMQDFPDGYRQLLQGQEFQFCALTSDPVRSQVSVLACPLVTHQEVLGDLWCFSPKEQALTECEVHLVKQVAHQCAIALEQARLYQDTQTQMLELKKLNQLKDMFLSTVSHELRTPLTNMKMALHLLRVVKTEEQRSRCLQILQTECDREIDLITDLLDLQQLEAENYPTFLLGTVTLQEWLPTILAPFWQSVQSRQQSLTVHLPETLPSIRSDQASLRRVLVELLRNAHKFTPPGGEIILTIEHLPDSDQVLFTLRNQAEILADDLPFVFEKFYRLPHNDPWKAGGTGLGLFLVRRLVEYLQGQIDVTSVEGWTTFSLQLPLVCHLE